MTVHRSACPLDCPDLCGLEVTVENGRVTKIEGDTRSPITDSFICGKVRKMKLSVIGLRVSPSILVTRPFSTVTSRPHRSGQSSGHAER